MDEVLEQDANEVVEKVESGQDLDVGDEETLPDESEATGQGGKQVAGTAPEQESDWTKDERFERMWKKDPSEMYRSYRSLEDQYGKVKPIQSEYEALTNKLNERGIPVDKLDEFIEEYHTLKDPNNPMNQDYAILQDFMNDPVSEQKLGNFFRELQAEKLQRQFPNMNQAQIEHQMKMQEELKSLKEAEQQRNQAAKEQEYIGVINKSTEKIVSFAKERGLEVTEDMTNDILQHCLDNNIPVQGIFSTFIEKYDKQLQEALENKIRDNFMKGKSKTDKIAVPSATKTNTPVKGNTSADNESFLEGVFRKAMGK